MQLRSVLAGLVAPAALTLVACSPASGPEQRERADLVPAQADRGAGEAGRSGAGAGAGGETGDGTAHRGTTAGGAAHGGTQPRFRGRYLLRVQRGHQTWTRMDCSDGVHLCAAGADWPTYAAFGRARSTVLASANMRMTTDHRAWLVGMQFEDRAITQVGRQADRHDDFVLVIDQRDRVLAVLDQAARKQASAVIGPVTKPEAWDLVLAFQPPNNVPE